MLLNCWLLRSNVVYSCWFILDGLFLFLFILVYSCWFILILVYSCWFILVVLVKEKCEIWKFPPNRIWKVSNELKFRLKRISFSFTFGVYGQTTVPLNALCAIYLLHISPVKVGVKQNMRLLHFVIKVFFFASQFAKLSVTRWLYYHSIFGHLQQWQFAP